MQTKKDKRIRRHRRVRTKIFGTKIRPRLSVFRSQKHLLAQLIDDEASKTLVAVSDKNLTGPSAGGKTKKEKAFLAGKLLADKAREKKIKRVVFDRGGYVYTGRVRELANGARDGGLEF
jgi:large subunit ribosomal protein L18